MTEQCALETVEVLKESPCTEEEFRQANRRRIELVKRKHQGLAPEEVQELKRVESTVDEYLDWRYPPSWEILEKAEAIAFPNKKALIRRDTPPQT